MFCFVLFCFSHEASKFFKLTFMALCNIILSGFQEPYYTISGSSIFFLITVKLDKCSNIDRARRMLKKVYLVAVEGSRG